MNKIPIEQRLQQIRSQTQQAPQSGVRVPIEERLAQLRSQPKKEPTIEQQKQERIAQGLPVSVREDRTQPTLVGGIIRDIVKQPIKAALTIARPFVDPIGKKSGLSVNTKYLGNVGDYGTEIEKSTNNLANKYKAGEISLGRAALGGAGAGALQAMDFAAVAPVGKVASQAIRGTVKQSLVPTLKAAAKESLIRGGAVGAGYDVSSQLASGEKYNPLQTVAAGTVGTVADLGLSYGLPKAISGTKSFAKNNLTKAGRDAKLTRKVEEELFNIENNYAKLRKNQKYSKDANTATRKRIVTTGVLDDAVDTNGTINADNAIKKYRDASGLSGKEGVVRQNLERLGEKLNIKDAEKQLTDTVYTSGLEGAELRTALNNVKKEVSGYRLRADADGNLPLTFFHDAKIGTTNSIDFNTPADIKAYKKTLASGLKDIVENNSQFNVKEVNKELSPLFKDIEYLESLNGRKVKGGKLGKYASQVTGNIVGGVAGGAIGGFPGSAIGTVVGGEVGSALRGSSLSKVLRGPGTKELPVSKVLQKAAATAKSPRLGLPEPKPGLPKSQNFVPIELPGVKEPVYRSPRIAGNTTQYTNIPNTKPKNIDIPTELPKSKVKSSDLSTPKKGIIGNAIETLKTLKDKNVRERGSISLEAILPESKSVGNQGVSLPKNTTEDLVQQAKKYKSAEVRDKSGLKLQDPYTAEYLPTNPDGTITLYHSTTKAGAEKIKQAGIFGSKTEGGDIYLTTNKKGYGGIGKDKDTVLAFNVDPKKVKFDDVYRGELHLKGNNADIGGIKPTDLYNKAQGGVTQSPLLQEAKKYKSAEEFVKAHETTGNVGTSFSRSTIFEKYPDIYQKNRMNIKPNAADKYDFHLSPLTNENFKLSNFENAEGFYKKPKIMKDLDGNTFAYLTKPFEKLGKQEKWNLRKVYDSTSKSEKPVFITEDGGKTFFTAENEVIGTGKTKSQLTDIWNKTNKKVTLPKSKDLSTELVQQAKKYKSAEEFVKAQGTPVYHGTKGSVDIKNISAQPESRGQYLGNGVYFTKYKEGAELYGGKILDAVVNEKDFLDISKLQGVNRTKEIGSFGTYKQYLKNNSLEDTTTNFKKWQKNQQEVADKILEMGYKGVTDGQQHVIFDKSTLKTKSQLEEIWNKSNKKILPKNTKLIRNKDGSVEYGSQKMSGDFKGMSDKEIIKMFEDTPF